MLFARENVRVEHLAHGYWCVLDGTVAMTAVHAVDVHARLEVIHPALEPSYLGEEFGVIRQVRSLTVMVP